MIDDGEDNRASHKEEGIESPLSSPCEPHAPTSSSSIFWQTCSLDSPLITSKQVEQTLISRYIDLFLTLALDRVLIAVLTVIEGIKPVVEPDTVGDRV